MSIFFTSLSIAYIAGIFLWADSPIVKELSVFNPYSLLHIPLYGILTILLVLSRLPFSFVNQTNQVKAEDKVKVEIQRNQTKKINQTGQKNSINSSNPSNLHREMRSLFHWGPINYFIPGLIALVVAVADEIHQAYVPGRDASVTDVLLDLAGIFLALIIIHQMKRKRLLGKFSTRFITRLTR